MLSLSRKYFGHPKQHKCSCLLEFPSSFIHLQAPSIKKFQFLWSRGVGDLACDVLVSLHTLCTRLTRHISHLPRFDSIILPRLLVTSFQSRLSSSVRFHVLVVVSFGYKHNKASETLREKCDATRHQVTTMKTFPGVLQLEYAFLIKNALSIHLLL